MEFEQVAPRRAEAADGTAVELVDRHHAQLYADTGTWIVELMTRDEPDWFTVTVYEDSLLRAGGNPTEGYRKQALDLLVEGLQALRIRVEVGRSGESQALADHDLLEAIEQLGRD